MIFFGVLIGIIIMGGMIYLAVDKKSTFKMRLASLGAIALMMISVIIALLFIFVIADKTPPIDYSTLVVGAPPAEPEKDENSIYIIIFTVFFFLILFAVIIFLTMREHKKYD